MTKVRELEKKRNRKVASLTRVEEGRCFRSPKRTQGIEATLQGVILALRMFEAEGHSITLIFLRTQSCQGNWIRYQTIMG